MWRAAVIAVAAAGCFNPAYDHPSCGPAGECPASLVCSAGTCVPASGDDGGTGDGGGGLTIQDVQNPAMAPGTAVALSGVVVTAIDTFGSKTGNLWVEEPGGGVSSGILVFNTPAAAVAALAVGDIVSISGAIKAEFALTADMSGRKDNELEPAAGGTLSIVRTGSGTVPPPAIVDALAIGQMPEPARSAAWAQYLGVLVTLSSTTEVGAPTEYGPGPDAWSFAITGNALVENELAAFPTGLERTTCLNSVTGIIDYFFNYIVLPRSTADVTSGGSGCPAPETACADGLDNDGNGGVDCADLNCIGTTASCSAISTILSLDTPFSTAAAEPTGVAGNSGFTLSNVVITAIAANGRDYWVADSPTAAANHGLYVFGNGLAAPSGFAVGKPVVIRGALRVAGNATHGQLELDSAYATLASTTVTPPTAVVASVSTLATMTTGLPYLGTLVTIPSVAVVTLPSAGTPGMLREDGVVFEAAGDMATALATGCYASITGIWIYDVENQAFALEPTLVGPVGSPGQCT